MLIAMTCMVAVLPVFLSLLATLALEQPDQVKGPDIAGNAHVNERSNVQTSALLHAQMVHADQTLVDEEGEEVDRESLTERHVWFDGTFVGDIAGATLVVHANTPAVHGHMQDWIIIQDRTCSRADVSDFQAALAPSVIQRWHGQAGKGLCAMQVKATKSALQHSIQRAKGNWSSKHTVVETSSNVKLFDAELSVSEASATASSRPSWWAQLWESIYTEPWNLDRIDDRNGLDNSYDITNGGFHTTVYVLDTGIRDAHVEFEGRALRLADFTTKKGGWCSLGDFMCARDVNGHGTHCAGTIAGKRYGVAKKAIIKAVKVYGDDGSGTSGQITRGMDVVLHDKIMPSVVAMSLGNLASSKAYEHAITQLIYAGIPVVVGAGDRNSDACAGIPAQIPGVITVGSTTKDDARSSFSNYGDCLDMFAPGSNVRSAWPDSLTGSMVQSSTSMACSAVAGAAALLLSKNASLSAWAVRNTLVHLATPAVITDTKSGLSSNRLLYVEEDMGQNPLREMSSVCIGNTGPVWAMVWWVKGKGQRTDGQRVFVGHGCCMSLADIPGTIDWDVLEIYAEGKLYGEGRLIETVVYRTNSGTGLYECTGPANSWKFVRGKINITVQSSPHKDCPPWDFIKEQNATWQLEK